MTFDDLELGQKYWFTYGGCREMGYCTKFNDEYSRRDWQVCLVDDDGCPYFANEVTDITRVPSESEWKRAQTIERAAEAFLCERNAIVYVPEVLMDALRTALESRCLP